MPSKANINPQSQIKSVEKIKKNMSPIKKIIKKSQSNFDISKVNTMSFKVMSRVRSASRAKLADR